MHFLGVLCGECFFGFDSCPAWDKQSFQPSDAKYLEFSTPFEVFFKKSKPTKRPNMDYTQKSVLVSGGFGSFGNFIVRRRLDLGAKEMAGGEYANF